MKRQLIAIAVGAAALQSPVPITAQAPTPPSVTFSLEVNYVDVDVVVTDENRNFVSGLTRDDFEVFEDGKPQKVDTFAYVEIPLEQDNAFLLNGRPISSDTKSNRVPFAGRLYVIVLDDQDVAAMRTAQVKKSAKEFVDKYMGANDVAAVIHTSGRTDAAQEFTNNKALLHAAIDKFVGRRMRSLTIERLDSYYQSALPSTQEGQGTESEQQPSSDPGGYSRMEPTEMERGYRAVGVLDTLKLTAEFLSSVRGRRKAVLFFSEGIDYPITDSFGAHSASDVIRTTQDAITAAARANVNFYTIDPRGLVGMTNEFMEMAGSGAPELAGGAAVRTPGTNAPITSILGGTSGVFNAQSELMAELMLSQGSLRELAEQTGGIASVNTNSLTNTFNQIVQANSRYYVLGYYPPEHRRDGRFHKIEVKTKRPGLRVAARRGYGSPRGRTAEERKRDEEARRAREAKRPNADKTSTQLRDVLTSPLMQSGLNFTVHAAPFKNTQKEASVALAIEIDGDRLQYSAPNAQGMAANKVELSFYGINQSGKAMGGTQTILNLTLRPETRERVKTFGLRVNPRISLPPGRYHLRIGAREELTGMTGTVFHDIEVPDFRKDKLMLGGLLLASNMGQQTPSIQPDPVLEKVLPAPATSRREFSQRDLLALYTEIYDNLGAQMARHIDVAVRIIAEDGKEVMAIRDTLENGGVAPKKPWDLYGYSREIALKNIAPGRYALRVEAQIRGNNDVKPVTRESLITVVP
ncbi:MAG TPA: VWA domain-containing protein [Vicinamibacterales bacterium]|nr:VWA domain-containing protein [Vicinamibacterales bacterium]